MKAENIDFYSLEECCDILDSQRIPVTSTNRKKGEYPYYGANGLQDYIDKYIFDDELVLLAEDGGNFGSKTRPIAYRVSGKCWVNNHAHVLKARSFINSDYLCYSLMFYDVSSIVNGATRQKLTQSAMRKMLVPRRSLEEQLKIVECLNKVQNLIDLRREEIAQCDLLVKARFVEMFGDPVLNDKGWEVKSLLEIGECKNGMNFRYDEKGVEINCLGVGDFKDKSVIEDVESLPIIALNEFPSKEYLLEDGDIVFVRSNGNKELVGRCVAVYTDNIPVTFSGFCIRFRNNNKNVEIPYLVRVLKADSIRKQMVGRGANIQNLNQQILKSLMIPVPPLSLQDDFANFVETCDATKRTLQASLAEAELLRGSLMQKWFWVSGANGGGVKKPIFFTCQSALIGV